ncbi:hypothetical protein BVX97_01960 [bacterium E08(2017)]|nr:hypothetical protein BVX97_01960 [bacterium E08(2017)]
MLNAECIEDGKFLMAKDLVTGVISQMNVVHWATVQGAKGGYTLSKQGENPVEDGVIQGDTQGIRGEVVTCVSSDQSLVRVIQLPDVEPDELADMVELQVDKFSPFPIERMVISHEVLKKSEDGCLVLVVAVKTEVVDQLGDRLKDAGITPDAIDIDVMGWLRVLRDEGKIRPEGRHVLIIAAASPIIMILQDGVPVAFRALAADDELPRDELMMELAGETGYTLMSLELEHGAAQNVAVDVYLEGDAPAGFADELSNECHAPANISQLRDLPSLAEGIAKRWAENTGSGVDLVPPSWRQAESSRQSKKKLVSLVAFLASTWLIMVGGFLGFIFYQERALASMQAEQVRWAKPANKVREMQNRIRIIGAYMDRTDSALECLKEVSELMPPVGLTLSTFNYKKGESLQLTGDADNRNTVLKFNDNLNKSKIFSSVVPGDIKIVRGKHRFSFILNFPEDEQ